MKLNIKMKLFLSFGVISAMMVFIGGTILNGTKKIQDKAVLVRDESSRMAIQGEEMQQNVIQVQQWLTDISATRGADGLDDGYAKSEENAQAFLLSVREFKEYFAKKNDNQSVQEMDLLEKDFNLFYANGKIMARTYIENGTQAGNRFMKEFDAYSGKIFKGIEHFSAEKVDELKNASNDVVKVAERVRRVSFIVVLIALVLAIFTSLIISLSISRPVEAILKVVNQLAVGDLSNQIEVKSDDELGQMSVSINRAIENIGKLVRSIANHTQSLSSAGEEMAAVSKQMSAASNETSAQAISVSAAAEQVSQNVQTVATASEEMTSSVKEISKNTNDAASVAEMAMKTAESTNVTIQKLGESSTQIGQVIKVITSIAQQTKLLALNATIEAARAGEAGKGFAVVANEVKELAKETARATEDISQRIESIQTDTKSAVGAIKQISAVIGQINDITNTIATAVQEQTATTAEISRNVSEAAAGSGQIAENISKVAKTSQDSTVSATETQKAAEELARLSGELQNLVSQFKYSKKDETSQLSSVNGGTNVELKVA